VSLRLPSCSVRVRALLYPIRLPVGYDQTMRLPLVPGALSDPSSRLVFHFALGAVRADIAPKQAFGFVWSVVVGGITVGGAIGGIS
jgi:hypothetical protein